MEPTPPPLTASQKQLLRRGIDLFNEQRFYDCHEVWEEVWLEAGPEQKTFLQGLIQVAVALHHLQRKNLAGAGRLLSAGMEKLSLFASQHEMVDLAGLMENLEPVRRKISIGETPSPWRPPMIDAGLAG